MSHPLRVLGFQKSSKVNGPGDRAVLHLQGCTLACKGCFNPESHPHTGGDVREVDELAQALADAATDGVTISGGEPFQQLPGLVELLEALCVRGVDSIVVFTGYTLAELQSLDGASAALDCIDLLIAGRYDATQHINDSVLASANQQLHALTSAHTPEEVGELVGEVEITISSDGNVTMTGFPPPELRRAVKRME